MTLIIQPGSNSFNPSILFTLEHTSHEYADTRIFSYYIYSHRFSEETPYKTFTTLDQVVKTYLGYAINQSLEFINPNDELLFLLKYLSPNQVITLDF